MEYAATDASSKKIMAATNMTELNKSFFPIEPLEIRSLDAARVAETLSFSEFKTASLSGRRLASNRKDRAEQCLGEWGIV